MSSSCNDCGGFIGEPGQVYGYAGKWCQCGWKKMNEPQLNETNGFKLIKNAYKGQSRDDLLMIIYKLLLEKSQ